MSLLSGFKNPWEINEKLGNLAVTQNIFESDKYLITQKDYEKTSDLNEIVEPNEYPDLPTDSDILIDSL